MEEMAKRNKGVALFLVLGVVLMVVLLTNIFLGIILSHSRLSHHQISRIQAYYAAWAGVNYAREMLRTGTWKVNTDCLASSPCFLKDDDFPSVITNKDVGIILRKPGDPGCNNPPGGSACISVTADYTNIP